MVNMRSLGPIVQIFCTLDIKRSPGIINTYPGLISDVYVFADMGFNLSGEQRSSGGSMVDSIPISTCSDSQSPGPQSSCNTKVF